MQDRIEAFGKGSLIQHGKMNDRVYLMKFNKADFPDIIPYVNNLARDHNYTKIFCKVPSWASPMFVSSGFIVEAQIPEFYERKEDVFFLSKFLNSDRMMKIEHAKLDGLTQQLLVTPRVKGSVKIRTGFNIKQLEANQAVEIAGIYKKVFDSYPFPIFNSDYILSAINNNVQFFGVEDNGQLIALGSAEVDRKVANAEMTDFATLPDYRGNNLSVALLNDMEQEMKRQRIHTLYTIARLNSLAMNKTFLKLNYKYAGTLINNTYIAGKIESMNVYYKHIV